jgi:hypothetical protein
MIRKITSTTEQISPPKDTQIHAQTSKSGDVGGILQLYLLDSYKQADDDKWYCFATILLFLPEQMQC